MRAALLWNPRLLCERLAAESQRRRRLARLRRTVARDLVLGHIASLELIEIARAQLPPNPVIYDIGAHVGTWALLAKACLPDAEVHCFEPLTEHMDEFRHLTANVEGINLHQIALGSINGTRTINILSRSDASSFLIPGNLASEHWRITEQETRETTVVRLDDYVQRMRIADPDIVKLDVQGYELEVLQGAERVLEGVSWLICEVSFREYYDDQPLFEDIIAYLREKGFRMAAISVDTPLGEPLTQTDVLFCKGEVE